MNLMALRFCTHSSLHFYSDRETTDSVLHLVMLKNHLRNSMECCFNQDQSIGQKSEKNKIQVKLSLISLLTLSDT